MLTALLAACIGALAKFFLGKFVAVHPSLTPEQVQGIQAAQDHITAAIATKTAVTEAAEAQAEAAAPATQQDIVDAFDKDQV